MATSRRQPSRFVSRAGRFRRGAGVVAAVSVSVVLFGLTCTSSAADTGQRRLDGLIAEMARRPTSDAARQVVAAIVERGDPSYGAYLLDLVRVGFSNTAADEALDALARLSGIERSSRINDEYVRYGEWVLEDAPAPRGDYLGFKAAVYRSVDVDFVPLLERVDDRRVLAGLQWGGVGVGAIGELNEPGRVPMTAPAWAQPGEEVYAMVGEQGTALVYPERILARHELANDVLDDVPVAVTFCTLCRSVRVYDRRVDGRAITLRTSGLLLHSNKVMVDVETGSLWQQFSGRALAGPLKGRTLRALDVEITTWETWLSNHGASVVVDKPPPTVIDRETGVPIGYEYEPGAALAHYYASNDLWYPVLAAPVDLAPKTPVATIDIDGSRLAVSIEALTARGPMVFLVAGRLVAARPVPGGIHFHDATGTGWPEGPLDDDRQRNRIDALDRLRSNQSFWFAWYGEHPDTDWWPRAP